MQKIILTEQQRKILANHARNEYPNESCAILFGYVDGRDTIVSKIFLTENVEKTPHNFTISNEQLIHAYKLAEEKNTNVVGIFHSHPHSEAYPSNIDRKFMHSNPVVWVIYSGNQKRFRAFVIEDDLKEVAVVSAT